MSVAKIIEVSSESETSFEDAIQKGIDKTAQSVEGVKGAWIKEQKVTVDENRITHYRVDMKVSFVIN